MKSINTIKTTFVLILLTLHTGVLYVSGETPISLNVNLGESSKDIELTIGGWMQIDYGVGSDRYGDRKGDDVLGVSQYAAVTQVQFDENISFVGVVGGTVLSNGANEDFEIRDAFMVWDNFLDVEGLTIKAGAQPILFGLKPNGYPGDRSLQSSVEYGANGLFAVSQQAGPAIVVSKNIEIIDIDLAGTISVGTFDHDTENDTMTDGSSLTDNLFAQIKIDQLVLEGLYAVAGIESRYVRGTGGFERDNCRCWNRVRERIF